MYLVEDLCLFLLNLKKKNLKYLATLPLAIASPSPAPDIFMACRGPRRGEGGGK